jgi:oligopeptide/dipeptide ABC transporter ATP-binding protein
MNAPVLAVDDLAVDIRIHREDTEHGVVQAVRGVSFAIAAGETLAVVGESGCGKTMTALAVMGLLPERAEIRGTITLQNQRIDRLDADAVGKKARNRLRGSQMGMVFQNPMSSLNPTMRIGEQIAEVLVTHRGVSWSDAHKRAVSLLDRMQMRDAAARAKQYPFEFSGGMLQRAMIAMAVACEPALLIADEPTTALDVTVQVEVLALLKELQREQQMALLLITHDMGVVARMADDVAVMYAGQIIEHATARDLFAAPAHPYTQGLLRALPAGKTREQGLSGIPGTPPDLLAPPVGCAFYARCERAMQICAEHVVPAFAVGASHHSRCWLSHPQLIAASAETRNG